MKDVASEQLLQQFRQGDAAAAEVIYDRYVRRLIALAQQRLSPRLAVRVDPEDVVQSAYRSFFVRARDGQFALERAGDLWRLLAQITLNKLCRQAERHGAQRRSVDRERADVADRLAAPEPAPEEVAAAVEQLERIMDRATPLQRQVLRQRLRGETIEAIAKQVDRSQRTVRRLLQQVREQLQGED